MIQSGKNYLISVRDFQAEDGLNYSNVWGKCEIITFQALIGFPPLSNSESSYFIKVSGEKGHTYLDPTWANFFLFCPEKPDTTAKTEHDGIRDRMRIYCFE